MYFGLFLGCLGDLLLLLFLGMIMGLEVDYYFIVECFELDLYLKRISLICRKVSRASIEDLIRAMEV